MKILDRLPIPEDRTSLRFGDKYVTVHRNQILVWVSVHLAGVLEREPGRRRAIAVLGVTHQPAPGDHPDRHAENRTKTLTEHIGSGTGSFGHKQLRKLDGGREEQACRQQHRTHDNIAEPVGRSQSQ